MPGACFLPIAYNEAEALIDTIEALPEIPGQLAALRTGFAFFQCDIPTLKTQAAIALKQLPAKDILMFRQINYDQYTLSIIDAAFIRRNAAGT